MGGSSKLLLKVLSGRHDAGIRFDEFAGLLEHLGFRRRTRGSRHIFTREGVHEQINLQADGSMGKRYQVKQVRDILTKYGIGEESDE